jgi:hypothetical protein
MNLTSLRSNTRPKMLLQSFAAVVVACLAPHLAAQDVAITNARIIAGNGPVIPSGTIIVRGGKIVSVGAGMGNTQGLRVIDAKGMSAMPGYIDAHKHINTGPNEKEQMQSLLEAGYTTILAGGGPGDGTLALRDHIESGMINGPRVLPSERVNLRGTSRDGRQRHQTYRRDRADARAGTNAAGDRSSESRRG